METPLTLTQVYEQIALERPQVCTGCGTNQRLSHSHLVPKSRSQALKTVKENIQYHCLSMGNTVGCHTKFESMDVVTMNDFKTNFAIIYLLDREYFWIRVYKLREYWENHRRNNPELNPSALIKIQQLINKCESSF